MRNYQTGGEDLTPVLFLDEEERLICVAFIAREAKRLLDRYGPLIG